MDVEQQFKRDTANHAMEIVKDDGVHRHIRFSKPGTGVDSFTLTTWPGHICFSGDRGTYVFSRVADMFEFFRADRINPGYWSEKCVASDRDGIREYYHYAFRRAVLTDLRGFRQSSDLPSQKLAEIRHHVSTDVLSMAEEDRYSAVTAAMDFEMYGFGMQDFYEHDVTKFTFQFLWCCHALVFGVEKYWAVVADA